MKKNIIALYFFCLAGTIANAQTSTINKHIPKDASTVVKINLPVMIRKINIAELITQIPPGKMKMPGKKKDFLTSLMQPPFAGGINLGKDFWVISNKQFAYDSTGYSIIIGSVSDTALFKKNRPPGAKIIRYQPNCYLASNIQDSSALVWTDTIFVYVKAKEPEKNKWSKLFENDEQAKNTKKINYTQLAINKAKQVLKGYATDFFDVDNSFLSAANKDADITIWSKEKTSMDLLKSFSKAGIKSPLPLPPGGLLGKKSKGRSTVATIRFDNGKISMQSTAILEDSIALFMKNFMVNGISKKLTSHVLPGKVLGMMSFHLELNALKEMPFLRKSLSNFENILAPADLTTDDIFSAFSGEGLIIFTAPEKGDTGKKIIPSVYFAAGVNNKTNVEKILALTDKIQEEKAARKKQAETEPTEDTIVKRPVDIAAIDSSAVIVDSTVAITDTLRQNDADSNYVVRPEKKDKPFGKMKAVRSLSDDVLVIAGTKSLADSIAAYTRGSVPGFNNIDIEKTPLSFFMDIQSIYNLMMAQEKPKTDKDKSVAEIFGAFDKIYVYSNKPSGNTVETNMDVNMTDNNTNSLQALLNMVVKLGIMASDKKP